MYNPFISATKAAFDAITCDEAKDFYRLKAQADTQAVIDTTLDVGIGLYQLCSFVYALGAATGEWVADTIEASQDATVTDLNTIRYLPAPRAVAALPAVSSAPKAPIITPAPIAKGTPESAKALTQGLANTDEFRKSSYLKLTKKQLIERCVKRGLRPKKSYTKAKLADMLTASYAPVKPWQAQSHGGRVVNIA